jgi:hypothetical protein
VIVPGGMTRSDVYPKTIANALGQPWNAGRHASPTGRRHPAVLSIGAEFPSRL